MEPEGLPNVTTLGRSLGSQLDTINTPQAVACSFYEQQPFATLRCGRFAFSALTTWPIGGPALGHGVAVG